MSIKILFSVCHLTIKVYLMKIPTTALNYHVIEMFMEVIFSGIFHVVFKRLQ